MVESSCDSMASIQLKADDQSHMGLTSVFLVWTRVKHISRSSDPLEHLIERTGQK